MSEAQRSGSPAVLSRGAFTVALIVLVAWCVFVVYMINTAGATELHWSRLAWLFTSGRSRSGRPVPSLARAFNVSGPRGPSRSRSSTCKMPNGAGRSPRL
jgi:hypothetical protein